MSDKYEAMRMMEARWITLRKMLRLVGRLLGVVDDPAVWRRSLAQSQGRDVSTVDAVQVLHRAATNSAKKQVLTSKHESGKIMGIRDSGSKVGEFRGRISELGRDVGARIRGGGAG